MKASCSHSSREMREAQRTEEPVGDLETISQDSNSYEMVEYGLHPYPDRQRRKSCLCWNPSLHFTAREEPSCTATVDSFLAHQETSFLGGHVSRTEYHYLFLASVFDHVLVLSSFSYQDRAERGLLTN